MSPFVPPAAGRALAETDALIAEVEALLVALVKRHGGEVLTAVVDEHLRSGGKRLRARLALAATAALGGDTGRAVPWAAACEIFHNATLVHDDLQDGDRLRRGEPTVWVRHGAAQAVNAGDLLLLLAFAAIAEVSAPAAVRAGLSAAMARLGSAVVAGQAAELVLLRSSRTQRQSYLETVTAKTSGLFELPVEGAALLCGHAPDAARRLGAAFRPLGILFQIQDDLLDLWGNKGREGPGSDLREGKVSALVVTHLERHPEDDDWLLALLRLPREQTPAAEMQRAIAAFEQGGARSETLAWMRALAAELGADPVLAGEARLLALAEELVAKVREPIAHLS